MRTSGRPEQLVSRDPGLRLSGSDHRRILRTQVTLRVGGLLVLAASSPLVGALRMDSALGRIVLVVLVYVGAEVLLARKTGRILTKIRERDANGVRSSAVDRPCGVADKLKGIGRPP